ncbi:hypothetical protein CPB83DRAFT_862843 [Crepidotus variabilis]|uniref:SH3 domain-containing protein n=1 Tax=Crepidotus variabilis TaxID=179855 RepID=A0A9P6E6J1_9AGAR|nr:hypothetical protein CPB83DRAFT_862843 [Crepidotus variabilis]
MVFTNLGAHEKDAFFALLDEYFSSRPDIFTQSDGALSSANVSAMKHAVSSNAESAAKYMSAGFKSAANAGSRFVSSAGSQSHGSGGAAAAESAENEPPVVAGRVAAAQAAWGPKKSSPASEKASISSLSSTKKFGDVDTSSPSGFVGSLRGKEQPKPAVHMPSAFGAKKNNFTPPPPRAPIAREPSPELEEVEGEWVEALYDYDSGETGDLKVAEGDRILLTERTSDDWWTGEIDGRKGLFPASYAKVL